MFTFGTFSYACAGALFLALSMLLATSWRGRLQGGLLLAACGSSAIWSFLLAYQSTVEVFPETSIFVAEIVRDAAWLGFVLRLLSGPYDNAMPRPIKLAAHALWSGILGYGVLMATLDVFGNAAEGVGQLLAPSALLVSLLGLVLVAQLYRTTPLNKRWAVEFLCFGVGGVFAYDVFLYSHALLSQQLDSAIWNARGLVNAALVPLLAVTANRNPQWSLNVFVSRQMIFYVAGLTAAGAYLLLIAMGGYYIRVLGGTWGPVAQTVFLVCAAALLLIVLFSAQARAKFKVFLSKHFYRFKYDYRDEWLRLIHTLSSPSPGMSLRERSIKAMSQIVGSRGGTLWLADRDQRSYLPVSSWNSSLPGRLPLEARDPLVRFLEQRQWIVDTAEHRRDPARYGSLELPEWLAGGSQDYLVVPLMHETQLLGIMVMQQARASFRLTFEEIDLLKTVGRQVASYLAQYEADQRLAEGRQFEAYNRLTAFIMHDLKNLVAQQSLVVENAARFRHNPDFFEDAIATIANSVSRMRRMLEQLTQRDSTAAAAEIVRLTDVVDQAVAKCNGPLPAPEVRERDESVRVRVGAESFAMALSHIIRNAQQATRADGSVQVRIRREGRTGVVEVADDGAGMDADFAANRLFRPFDTTKGSQGMGMGAYQAREFVHAAGGDVNVTTAPGAGTTFKIILPLHER
ncbi:MAG TPA: XrtA/PEP-CTERM system histidine kinase PrsK [Gammaproteobacteria bacterium]|nr:XrtA/PEP-CTERM system histidine kinase PrsK [Gammaproteobacteria bacterium]